MEQIINQIIDYLSKEGKAVKGAPLVFCLIFAASCFVACRVIDWHYSERINTLSEEINNYKVQLEGATPEQAAKQIALLQRKIQDFEHGNVAMHCSLPLVPAAIMEPMNDNMFDRMEELLKSEKAVNSVSLYDYAKDSETCHIKLNACQKMITETWKLEGKDIQRQTTQP